MRELFKKYLEQGLSRRDFTNRMLGLGFSQIAVNSFLASAVEAREPIAENGKYIIGNGADILAETLMAADVDYIFGTSATGMS